MPTPAKGYYLKDGTRVPGTTTIIGLWGNKEGLVYWAWDLGMQGKDYRQARDDAASIGSAAHAMVEADIKGHEVICSITDSQMAARAASAFSAYLTWKANFGVEIIETERQFVSEKYRYGGTPDAIGIVGGKLALLDWKTSNSVKANYLLQLAAYQQLWEENFPDRPLDGGAHLLRFAKEHGDFTHHYYSDLTEERQQFLALRECYERDKRISKRAA